MRTALLILIACAAPALASQAVWKWVDDKGVVHYSDRPVPGATRIEISTGTRAEPAAAEQAPAEEPSSLPAEPARTPYQTLQITSPGNNETVVNTAGQVTVQVQLEPGLQSGHSLYLYLDGFLVEGFPPTGTSHTLTNVPRGTHTLIATVNDSRGRRFQESPVATFSVRQASVANPPVGPSLRPPPKPRTNRSGNRVGNKLPSKQPSYADLNGAQPKIDPATNLPVQAKIDKKLPTVPGKSP
jgi:hypothetical protein